MAKRKKRSRGSLEREKFLRELGVKYAKELTERATSSEVEFRAILDKAGLEYHFQYPVVWDRDILYIVDFYLPKYNLVFEIDGWQHDTKEGRRDDKVRTRHLNKLGMQVKRFRNFVVQHVTVEFISQVLKSIKN